MKYIEFRDLNTGDHVICAWHNKEYHWFPVKMVINKYGPQIVLMDPDDNDFFFSINEFLVSKKGKDIKRRNIFELAIFDSMDEANKWCVRENNFREKYIDEIDG